MEVTSVQYGFRDANHAWSDTQDDGYKKGGYIETPECRKCYTKRRGTHGLIIFGITTDDTIIAHTDNEDGHFLIKEYRAYTSGLWESTFEAPCLEYIGMKIAYNEDGSATLTQPSQVLSVQEHFFKSDPVPVTFLPLPNGWSPISSKLSPRCNLKQYQQDLGTVAFMRLTMGESNTISLLSSQSHNPSVADLLAFRHFAAFIVTRRDVGITFHPGPPDSNINVCASITCYTDASPGENLNGESNLSFLIKLGEPGHPGGAIIQRNTKQHGLIADSVPAAELAAYHLMTKSGIWCRHLLERFAGIVPDGSTDLVSPNSAPPSWVGIDSGSVQSLLSNQIGNGKNMRSSNITIHFCRSLTREKLFIPVPISTVDQLADIGTKQHKSPTDYWRAVVGAIGVHPAILDMQNRIRQAHGRSDKRRKLDGGEGDGGGEGGGKYGGGGEGEDGGGAMCVLSLSTHTPLAADEDEEDMLRGELTVVNTVANAERDGLYRQLIEDHVQSGNGHLIAQGFATSKEELDFVLHTQSRLTKKISVNSKPSRRFTTHTRR